MIRAIAAIDDRRGIGLDGVTPWHIPEELQYFKEQTLGKTILMGRQLYEIFDVPLAGRRNVVASRGSAALRPGFERTQDAGVFLEAAREEIWIIGGTELFETTLSYCDELYITRVSGDFGCDRFFPEFEDHFVLMEESSLQTSGPHQYTFQIYRRK